MWLAAAWALGGELVVLMEILPGIGESSLEVGSSFASHVMVVPEAACVFEHGGMSNKIARNDDNLGGHV
jgi:hypothetical protein